MTAGAPGPGVIGGQRRRPAPDHPVLDLLLGALVLLALVAVAVHR